MPRNPGPHNVWLLSRQVTETLILAFFLFLTPITAMVSATPFHCPQQTPESGLWRRTPHPAHSLRGVGAVPRLAGWGGGVRMGSHGVSLSHRHPPGGMPPQQLALSCLPVWLPSSGPSCSNMPEFQERLWGCRGQPGTEAAREGGAELPLPFCLSLPLCLPHLLSLGLLSLGPPTQPLSLPVLA